MAGAENMHKEASRENPGGITLRAIAYTMIIIPGVRATTLVRKL